MNFIEKLKAVRGSLLKLHRELIDSEKAVYEKSAGPISSPSAFLQLLTTDPWFEWLRPSTQLIAAVDDALFDKKNPITEERAEELLGKIRSLLESPSSDSAFGIAYADVLKRDAHVLATHAEVRRLLQS